MYSPFCVSENFWYRKMLGIREGAGITIFRQNCFCLTVPNHFVQETFCVSESFAYRKILCLRGEYPRFSIKNCCLTIPKNFVEEPFCVLQNFLYRKILCIRKGEGREGVSRFSVKNFCLTVSKNFVEETFRVSLFSGTEKFYA